MRSFVYFFSITSLLVCFTGCGSGLTEVKGKVTWNGNPVDKALVSLFREDEGPLAAVNGLTDSSGEFTLLTNGEPGVPSGKYKVTVTKIEEVDLKLSDEDANDPLKAGAAYSKAHKGTPKRATGGMRMPPGAMMPGMSGLAPPTAKHLLPEKYSKVNTTPIPTFTVGSGDLDITLEGEAPKHR